MSSRHTVNLNNLAYDKLKKFGNFGESYSELIIRLLEFVAEGDGEKNDRI